MGTEPDYGQRLNRVCLIHRDRLDSLHQRSECDPGQKQGQHLNGNPRRYFDRRVVRIHLHDNPGTRRECHPYASDVY